MNESKMMAKRLKRVLLQDKITAYEGLTKIGRASCRERV